MVQAFSSFSLPTEVIYGPNSASSLGDEVKRLGGKKAFFVTDKGVMYSGILEGAIDSLRRRGISFHLFDEAPVDPDDIFIDRLAAIVKEQGCDCVVGAGGGSAMCSGKGAALVAANPGHCREYFGNEKYPNLPLLCVCIPTTAGSGSEVSKHTSLTDSKTNVKTGILGFTNASRVAILDPVLLMTVPRSQAVGSGVDALTHAVEAFLSSRATPLTDSIAWYAIEAIIKNFYPSLFTSNLAAKGEMMLAATSANIACGNAGLGLVHGLNGVMTFYYKSHGLTPVAYGTLHCILLPSVLEFNLVACEEKVPALAQAMGILAEDKSPSELRRLIVEHIKELMSILQAPRKMPWEGVKAQEIVDEAMRLGRLSLNPSQQAPNPRHYTKEDVVALVQGVLPG